MKLFQHVNELITEPKNSEAVSAYEALPSNCPINLVAVKVSVLGNNLKLPSVLGPVSPVVFAPKII
jgi:hypothetical protein